MRLKLFAAFLFSSLFAAAQPDSLDNIVYKVYGNWKSLPNETFRQFTYTGTGNSYCVVTIYQARPSQGNKNIDFNTEWAERVEKNFTVFTLSAPKMVKNKYGHISQRLGAKATDKDGKS